MMMLFLTANLPLSLTDANRGKVLESCPGELSAQNSSQAPCTWMLYKVLIGVLVALSLISEIAFRLRGLLSTTGSCFGDCMIDKNDTESTNLCFVRLISFPIISEGCGYL